VGLSALLVMTGQSRTGDVRAVAATYVFQNVMYQATFLDIILKIHSGIAFSLNLAASPLTAVAAARHRLRRRPQSSP